jgi:hypothetical protein
MEILFHKDAEIEFNHSIDYYKEISQNLGLDFTSEVYKSIQRISSHPSAWSSIETSIRRILVNRFPFGVLYSHQQDNIYIIAIMNLHREPNYWKDRLD